MQRKKLKLFRVEQDLTQSQMAERLGISQPTYSAIEKGERQPSCNVLMKLHEEFEIDNVLDLIKEEKE